MSGDLKKKFAYQLDSLIEKNKLDPVYLTEYLFDAYESSSKNTKLAFVNILKKQALKEAENSRKRQKTGKRLGFFDGMPISWKDVIDISYAPALAGSKVLEYSRNTRNIKDSTIFKKAKARGLISIAKTSTVEFAFGGLGLNKSNPLPYNIRLGRNYLAGGSSTGSAAAVFAGISPISVGTDTAGSVRIPAAWHGLVGFKPSYKRISKRGILPLSKTYDTVGIISKCVLDAKLLFGIISKKNLDIKDKCNKDLKICLVKDFITQDLNAKALEEFEFSLRRISKIGYKIQESKMPEFFKINEVFKKEGYLVNYEAWNYWKNIIKFKLSDIDHNVKKRFLLGKEMKKIQIIELRNKIKKIKKDLLLRIENFDFLILPTLSINPPTLKKIDNDKNYSYYNEKVLSNTRIANIFNFSAITLPVKKIGNHFFSITLLAKSNDDERLLMLAQNIENIL